MSNIYSHIYRRNVITIDQGTTYTDEITIEQTEEGAPVDLTGYSVQSQLRDLTGSLAAEIACAIPSPASGVVQRSISAEDTAALVLCIDNPLYVWGLRCVNGGNVFEIKGGALVQPSIVEPPA
ncbi:MAG: hypothetical protein A2Y38_24930 [Spirochaetes bacterium GWB1_59_5]|nr:MAG: hypothetical protein A2Y38_24930 [Spirochaetes bacterium GWB1_59_5]